MQIATDITVDDLVTSYLQLRRAHAVAPAAATPLRRDFRLHLIIIWFLTGAIAVLAAALTGTFLYFDNVIRMGLLGASVTLVVATWGIIRAVREDASKPSADAKAEAALRARIRSGEKLDIGPRTLTLTPDGVEWTGRDIQVALSWRLIESVRDLPDYIAFCRSAHNCIPVPKRTFADAAAAANFLAEATRLHAPAAAPPTYTA
jgi:hypothetical protein